MPEMDFLPGLLSLFLDSFAQHGFRRQCGNWGSAGMQFVPWCQQAPSLASGWSDALSEADKKSLSMVNNQRAQNYTRITGWQPANFLILSQNGRKKKKKKNSLKLKEQIL